MQVLMMNCFLLLTNTHDREVIRQTIIDTYFTDFKADIESLIAEEQQIDEYRQALLQQVKQNIFISTTLGTHRNG